MAVNYQGCADYGLCYPPETRQVRLDFSSGKPVVVTDAVDPAGADSGTPQGSEMTAEASADAGSASLLNNTLTEEQRLAGRLEQGSLLSSLAHLLPRWARLAFTPCVLPMVPILSSIIVGEARASLGRARFPFRWPMCWAWR